MWVGQGKYWYVHVYLPSFPSLISLPLPSPTFSKLLCTSPSPLSFPSISPLHSPPLPLHLPFPSPLSPLPSLPSLLLRITTHQVPSWNQSQSRTLRATRKLSSSPLVSRPVHTSPATPNHTHHAQPPALHTCIQCKWQCLSSKIYASPSPPRFVDLRTISQKLSDGYYTCCWLFLADVKRVFANCRMYCDIYHSNPEWSKAANTLERYFNSRMKESGAWVDIGL